MPEPITPNAQARRLPRPLRLLRAAWLMLGVTLALILAVELLLRLAFAAKDAVRPLPYPDPRVVAEGYDGASWVPALFAEQQAIEADWRAFELFRVRSASAPLSGVGPDGLRRTRKLSPEADAGAREVWVFGGSTVWGWGARSDHTIPSLLAESLDPRADRYIVRNFGQIGYVTAQDVLTLRQELASGKRPDVAIFYGGVNDVLAALQNGEAGLPQNEANRAREFNILARPGALAGAFLAWVVADSAWNRLAGAVARRLFGARPVASKPFTAREAERVLAAYAADLRLAAMLGREHGFPVVAAWQPDLFTRRQPTDYEREKATQYDWLRAPLGLVRQAIDGGRLDSLGVEFLDLGAALDEEPGLVFVDFCHVTERGNALLAQALAGRVATILDKATSSRRRNPTRTARARRETTIFSRSEPDGICRTEGRRRFAVRGHVDQSAAEHLIEADRPASTGDLLR